VLWCVCGVCGVCGVCVMGVVCVVCVLCVCLCALDILTEGCVVFFSLSKHKPR
jgi:hypothetical protein